MLALAASACLSTAAPASAITPYEVRDINGNPFVTLRIFNVGDGEYANGNVSTWNLPVWQINQIKAATNYWGQILQTVPGRNPAIINVGTFDGEAAAANSWNATPAFGSPSAVQAALTNQPFDELQYDAHGYILVGHFDWSTQAYTPSQLALNSATSLDTVLVHEVAHALGVLSNAYGGTAPSGEQLAYFNDNLNAWSSHLRDDNGKAAAPNQYILCATCAAPFDDDDDDDDDDGEEVDVFDVRQDRGYFAGTQVSEVLNGAMKGLPMRVQTDYGSIDSPIFSHIELKNGLMSHQYYRNYNTLMEAELAALQDIGYTIDRRNFYGNSVYNDGLTLINDNPFFARNSAGTAYIANTYNMAPLGVGLHVYGSNNNITQRADLLSAGAGGAGIRVDGEANALIILPATRVHADGANGRAIMFAYGKDHSLTQRGDVEALGDNGVAVSFDFGHNSRGDATGYRGSYIVENVPADLLQRQPDYLDMIHAGLDGPLVSTFDLTGRLAGNKAAIFMSENALVGEINIMQGAKITGDIISNYDQKDENGYQRLTELTFGLEPDSDGHATIVADADFRISYADDILGKNLSLQFLGGTSTLTGNHDLYNVNIASNATLAGSGTYTIIADQRFINQGRLSPSITDQAITINGNYTQSETGTLQLTFDNMKAISSLIVNGVADLDGAIAFAPTRGFYGNAFSLTSDQWLQAETVNGTFSKVTTSLASPTLMATATDNGDNSYTVQLTRAANAYAQYGDTQNSQSVSAALDLLIGNPAPALQPLIAALDFSAADGSTIRSALPQLSGEAYASASGVLANASGATRSAVNNRLSQAFGGTPVNPVSVLSFGPDDNAKATPAGNAINRSASTAITQQELARYTAWGSAFGSWSSQSSDGNAARTKSTLGGFISGIDANVYDNWRLGVMAGYSRSTFKTASLHSSGSSDNYTFGAYSGTEWETAQGSIGLRTGLSYSWHTIELSRSVAFNGFSDSLSADYNAGTFQAFGELGYKYNLSQHSVLEPYANLAYMHVRTDGFTENGHNGAALAVQSGTMNTTLSMLGLRASTSFDLGNTLTTARVDLGWRHAFGDVIPTSTASFAAGSNAFTSAGNSIGKDTTLIEAGLDFAITKNSKLGVYYQGQFGSGFIQNGVNTNFSMKF